MPHKDPEAQLATELGTRVYMLQEQFHGSRVRKHQARTEPSLAVSLGHINCLM